MSKEVLAVDMDELFFPFAAHFVAHHNQHYGTNLQLHEIEEYRFEDYIGEETPETVRRVHEATEVDHGHISPIEGSPEAVRKLEKRFELVVVTARSPLHEAQTIDWLSAHYPDLFSDVIHVGHAGEAQKPKKKVDICKMLGAIALVDDTPHHLEECIKENIEGVIFGNYGWNQDSKFSGGKIPDGITRCNDWPAVLEHFDARR